MKIIEASVRYPVSTAVGVILLVLFGLISLFRIPVQLTPNVVDPQITVTTLWPGASPHEVEEIFEVPFAFLMDVANHQAHTGFWQGQERRYYAMPYESHNIWGATAGMIRNLYDRLYA